MHIFSISIGQPRGMGAITHILVKDPSGGWATLYEGEPRVEAFNEYDSQGRYFNWAPPICRAHFPSRFLRIQMDTDTIGDWNYIDYVQVTGSRALQPSIVPSTGGARVLYVADEHAEGLDSLEYRATDCGGSVFRQSTVGQVDIRIQAVNDLPFVRDDGYAIQTDAEIAAEIDGSRAHALDLQRLVADVEAGDLVIEITSAPPGVELYDGATRLTAARLHSRSTTREL